MRNSGTGRGPTMQYSERVLGYFDHPRHVAVAPVETPRGRAGDVRDGAIVEFYPEIADGRLVSMTFRAWGCPHTLAVAGWVCDELPGSAVDELCPLPLERIVAELELPANKWHCVIVAEDALRRLQEEIEL